MPDAIEDYKPLFLEWLKDLEAEAEKKGKRIALGYRRALMQMKRYEGRLSSRTALRQVQFIGKKTADILIEKLKHHCEEKSLEFPSSFADTCSLKGEDDTEGIATEPKSISDSSGNKRKSTALELEVPTTRKRRTTKRAYIPKHRSGGYAILIVMVIARADIRGMVRTEICEQASEYCDNAFSSNPASGVFYSAWQSINTLLNNDLVYKHGRSPARYYLTEEGKDLGLKLAKSSNIIVEVQNEDPDISFDNNIRLSSECQLSNDPPVYTLPFNRVQPQVERPLISRYDVNPNEANHDRNNCTLNGVRYEVWEANEYEIFLVVDNREVRSQLDRNFFPTRLKELGVPVLVETLSIGDALWIAQHKETKKKVVLDCIAERKRIDDLVSSIKDGRFIEQKTRLKRTALENIYYIVEEAPVDVQEMTDSIQTAMSGTITDSKFHLARTKSADETVQFFVSMTEVIKKKYNGNGIRIVAIKPINCDIQDDFASLKILFKHEFSNRRHQYECCHLFYNFQATLGKSDFLTVKDMFIQMLMTIRGLSLDKAIAIQKHFHTPKGLIEFFKFEHAVTRDSEKKDLIYQAFKNQVNTKKIGRPLLERIFQVWGK